MEQPDHDNPCWNRLADYFGETARLMGLGLWRFDVVEADDVQDGIDGITDACHALSVSSFNDYLAFRVSVYSPFWKLRPHQQRQMVCHELCHVINGERQRLVEGLASCGVMGGREYSLFDTQYRYADERITDWFATLLAPNLPLPDLSQE